FLVDSLDLDDRGVDGHRLAGEVAVDGVVLAALGDVATGVRRTGVGAGGAATRLFLVHRRRAGRQHEGEARPRHEGQGPPRVLDAHAFPPRRRGAGWWLHVSVYMPFSQARSRHGVVTIRRDPP